MGYSPWGRIELDTTKQLSTHEHPGTTLRPGACRGPQRGLSRLPKFLEDRVMFSHLLSSGILDTWKYLHNNQRPM